MILGNADDIMDAAGGRYDIVSESSTLIIPSIGIQLMLLANRLGSSRRRLDGSSC